MSDQIRMDFDEMEAMQRAFKEGADKLQEMIDSVNKIAQMIEDGALIGESGQAFSDACRSGLAPSIGRLKTKFMDMERDLQFNVDEMRKADQTAKGYYQ